MGAQESATTETKPVVTQPVVTQPEVTQPEEESDDGSEIEDQLHLLKSGDQADFTLICDDRYFKVHTHIVGARSDILRSMLYSLKRDRTLKITVVSANILKILLHYMYSGKVPPMSVETVLKVHKAATMFAMDSLENICKRIVRKKISESNATTVLTFASQEDATDLKDIAVAYLAGRKNYLLSGSWRKYCANNPVLAIEVLLDFVRRAP